MLSTAHKFSQEIRGRGCIGSLSYTPRVTEATYTTRSRCHSSFSDQCRSTRGWASHLGRTAQRTLFGLCAVIGDFDRRRTCQRACRRCRRVGGTRSALLYSLQRVGHDPEKHQKKKEAGEPTRPPRVNNHGPFSFRFLYTFSPHPTTGWCWWSVSLPCSEKTPRSAATRGLGDLPERGEGAPTWTPWRGTCRSTSICRPRTPPRRRSGDGAPPSAPSSRTAAAGSAWCPTSTAASRTRRRAAPSRYHSPPALSSFTKHLCLIPSLSPCISPARDH